MSILEDLDLMDLLDELPAGSDFDLDDILFEFSTPGLFASPEKEPDVPPVVDAEETVAESSCKTVAEESVPAEIVVELPPEETVAEFLPEEPVGKNGTRRRRSC